MTAGRPQELSGGIAPRRTHGATKVLDPGHPSRIALLKQINAGT
jgi:hypothetical protein